MQFIKCLELLSLFGNFTMIVRMLGWLLEPEIIPVEPDLVSTSEGNTILSNYPHQQYYFLEKSMRIFLFAMLVLASLFSCQDTDTGADVVIYSYDSFANLEWGAASVIGPAFEEATGLQVEFISAGDAGQVLARAIAEKDNPQADIVLGIDNNMLAKALSEDFLLAYKPQGAENIPSNLLLDSEYRVTPFDYGYFSIIYDSTKITNPPQSLEDLTKPEFENKLILMDPRTSSPGLGFLLWSIQIFGDDYLSFWEQLKPSILTITDGWDSGYGLFTAEEAPMVLSYTTSPAYHVEYEETDRFQAAIFTEGHYAQIESMGILKNAPNQENAKIFLDFMLSQGFQGNIALTNWMYPIEPSTVLPASFDFAPKPTQTLQKDFQSIEENLDTWLQDWSELMSQN
jgi:thiamine transport system substrate-binding protein